MILKCVKYCIRSRDENENAVLCNYMYLGKKKKQKEKMGGNLYFALPGYVYFLLH